MPTNHVFRDGPFEADSLPLDCARVAFEWLVTEPAPLGVDGRLFPGLPARRVPMDELRTLLLDGDLPISAVDVVWAHLVTRARDQGGAWTVACVGIALPALFQIAAELGARFAQDLRDLHSAILTGFLTELAGIDLARPWVMWRLRCAALREGHLFLREALDRPLPSEEEFHSREHRLPWGHVDLVLARAVAEGVITGEQAELIGATRLEPDYTLTHAATDRGLSYDTLAHIRHRAERRLVAWLREQTAREPGAGPDSDVELRALDAVTIAEAAASTAQTTTPHPDQSRTVSTGGGTSWKKVRGRVSKKTPKSGVDSRGRTPAAPAHTPLTHPACRHPPAAGGNDFGGAAMRLIHSPVRRRPTRHGHTAQPAGATATAPVPAPRTTRLRQACGSRSRDTRPVTAPRSTGATRRHRTGRRVLFVIELIAVAVWLSASLVHAQTAAASTHVLADAAGLDQAKTVLNNIRNWVMGLLAAIATVFLTIGGVRYVLGGGDPGEIEKAKTAFKAAGIGYGLAALAPLVVTILQGIVGS